MWSQTDGQTDGRTNVMTTARRFVLTNASRAKNWPYTTMKQRLSKRDYLHTSTTTQKTSLYDHRDTDTAGIPSCMHSAVCIHPTARYSDAHNTHSIASQWRFYRTFSLGEPVGAMVFGRGHSIGTTTGLLLRTMLCKSLVLMPGVKVVEKYTKHACWKVYSKRILKWNK